MLKTAVLTSVLALSLVNTASAAGKAHSWDLSRALIKGIDVNPRSVWSFMQNTSGIDNPANYTLLPNYSSTCFGRGPLKCWTNTGITQPPIIGVATKTYEGGGVKHFKGYPMLHPGDKTPVILRWQSPINGKVNIMGKISTIDFYGDGVNWSLKNNNAEIIRSGHLNPQQGAVFTAQNIAISKGQNLYFSVDMNGYIYNDSTRLDLLITSQQ